MQRLLLSRGRSGGLQSSSLLRNFALFGGAAARDPYAVCKDQELKDTEYDLVVIGGGSGGIACANRAANQNNLKVALLDFVRPSPQGTKWGLGGTCLNVGCIPKKLMHHASILKENMLTAQDYGFEFDEEQVNFDWDTLRDNVQSYIRMSNYDLRTELVSNKVKYLNCLGALKSQNEVLFSPDQSQIAQFAATSKADEAKTGIIKAKYIVIAVGGRPVILSEEDLPGSSHIITSDDLFSLKKPPGRSLMIGAGYIAVECASFLHKLGFPTTLLARSTVLRTFDEGPVNHIKKYIHNYGIDLREYSSAKKIELLANQKLKVEIQTKGVIENDFQEYDTVMAAISRYPLTAELNLANVGVKVDPKSKKVIGGFQNEHDLTSVSNIYAIGDVLEGVKELTPLAKKNGWSVADRIAKKLAGKTVEDKDHIAFQYIPTTVFSYPEYSTCGLTEKEAKAKYGEANIEVRHMIATQLEEKLINSRFFDNNEDELAKIKSYFKIISFKPQPSSEAQKPGSQAPKQKAPENGQILGLHFVGNNAGEIMQGFSLAMMKGLTVEELHSSVGIHPTMAESFLDVRDLKVGDEEPEEKEGC